MKNSNTTRNRLNFIDELKGFAILCVVIGHVMLFCLKSSDTSLCYHIITSFHMPLFAFLSGLMFKSKVGFKATATKFGMQTVKLLIPFMTVGMAYTYLMLNSGGVKFLTNNAKFGYWYMLFLWMCYLLHHLSYMIYNVKLKGNNIRYIADIIWMILVVGLFKVVASKYEVLSNIAGATWMFRMYPFFLVGALINRECLFGKIFGNDRQRWFDAAGVLYIIFLSLVMTVFSGRLSLTDAAAPFAIYAVVWLFYKYKNANNKIKALLEKMGKQSLAIYLFHYFFVKSFCLSELPSEFINNNQFLMSIFSIIVATGICFICLLLSWLVRHNHILSFLLLGNYTSGKEIKKNE